MTDGVTRRVSARSFWAAAVLVVSVAAFVFTYVTAVLTRHGQWFENLALHAADSDTAPLILQLVTVLDLAIATAVIVGIALLRRRVDAAIRAVSVLALSNVLAQVLKYGVLSRPRLGTDVLTQNTFPSGHTTAYVSVLLALLIVVSDAWRPWVATVGAVLCGTVVSLLLGLGMHRLSDVAGASALVLAVASLVVIVIPSRQPALPRRQSGRIGVVALVVVVAVAGVVGLALVFLARFASASAGILILTATVAFAVATSTLAIAVFLALVGAPVRARARIGV